MQNILELENVNVNIEGFSLENITFTIPTGYIMGLIGENGAGKTTLINTILGIYSATTGKINIGGRDVYNQPILAKENIGFALNDFPFPNKLTALECAKCYGRFYKTWNMNKFIENCKKYEIPLKKRFDTLSKGILIKFQLAFSLSYQANLFIFDEPSKDLDPVFRKEFLYIMHEIVENGDKSILISSHLTDELDRIADYITYLNKGKVLFSLSKEEINQKYALLTCSEKELLNLEKNCILIINYKENFIEVLINRLTFEAEKHSHISLQTPALDKIMYLISMGGGQYV